MMFRVTFCGFVIFYFCVLRHAVPCYLREVLPDLIKLSISFYRSDNIITNLIQTLTNPRLINFDHRRKRLVKVGDKECSGCPFNVIMSLEAVCSMQGNPSRPMTGIRGIVLLTQSIDECSGSVGPLLIKVDVAGFPHDGRLAYHGFHLHEMSDFSNGCESFGPHYNPYQTVHGGPKDHLGRRHLGDLGNVVKDPSGFVQGVTKDPFMSLFGPFSILGRGLVIHENPDDLGRGGNDESLMTGNSGGRVACCKIVPIY